MTIGQDCSAGQQTATPKTVHNAMEASLRIKAKPNTVTASDSLEWTSNLAAQSKRPKSEPARGRQLYLSSLSVARHAVGRIGLQGDA